MLRPLSTSQVKATSYVLRRKNSPQTSSIDVCGRLMVVQALGRGGELCNRI